MTPPPREPIHDFRIWSQVNEALQGYADALDRADIEGLLSHFHPSARWHYSPVSMRQGHSEIRDFFLERLSVFARTSHNVSAPVLRAAEPGYVRSTAYFIAEHQLTDGSRYRVCGRYIDLLRVEDDRAVICERTVIAHVTEGTDRTYNMLVRHAQTPGSTD